MKISVSGFDDDYEEDDPDDEDVEDVDDDDNLDEIYLSIFR